MDTPRAGDGNMHEISIEPRLADCSILHSSGRLDLKGDRTLFSFSGDPAVTIGAKRLGEQTKLILKFHVSLSGGPDWERLPRFTDLEQPS